MRQASPHVAETDSETQELRERVRELEEALAAIRAGQVDALVIRGGVATSDSAVAAANRLRQGALEQMRDAVLALDRTGHVVYMNPAAEKQYGWTMADALGQPKAAIYHEQPDPIGAGSAAPACVAQSHVLQDGRTIHVESTISPLLDGAGMVFGSVAVVRDVTDRRRAEARRDALAKLGECLRGAEKAHDVGVAAEHALAAGLGIPRASRIWFDDGAAAQVISITQSPVPGHSAVPGSDSPVERIRTTGWTTTWAAWNANSGRHWAPAEVDFARDVDERRRVAVERIAAVEALRESEAQLREANEGLENAVRRRTAELMAVEEALRQAQKMEAVGQLTGGIAHDFNNLLASISGALQVLRVKLAQGKSEGCDRYIDMGLESVNRAAALTQRLLAFARRQTLDAKPTDVNHLIAGMEDLVRRTVGSSVSVEVSCSEGLWATRIDSNQLENALLNLCINARDAMMPAGGRLTIQAANHVVEGSVDQEHGLEPGEYVVLSVRDTGAGMAPELIDRIFDPFFTTKPLGQGTGLGLSMVYGFVRQSGGEVRVFSELGAGTTMSLFLPRHDGAVPETQPDAEISAQEGGRGETVLVIEDHETIRVLVGEVLEGAGYRVMTAEDGPSGLKILQRSGRIDLLITDVGLPGGLNGRQVADAARIGRPGLKVLFITGYADSAAVGNGHLDSGMEILAKPFELEALTRRVRDMIG